MTRGFGTRFIRSVLCLFYFAGCASTGLPGSNGEVGPQDSENVPSPQESLPQLNGNFVEYIANLPIIAKDSEAAFLPSSESRRQFRGGLEALFRDEISMARGIFLGIGYELSWFQDPAYPGFYFLQGADFAPMRGWGYFAIRPDFERNLILQAPHAIADMHTETLAAEFFLKMGARALMIAGAHRCANSAESPCSGTTEVCSPGVSNPFRETDAAHSDILIFQEVHRTLMDNFPLAVALGIHGFAHQAGEPHSYLSDGTQNVLGADRLSNRLTALLGTHLGDAALAKSCNDGIPGFRLCGTTDIQGRYANGSSDACLINNGQSLERYFHLEFSKDLRSVGDLFDPQQVLDSLLELF